MAKKSLAKSVMQWGPGKRDVGLRSRNPPPPLIATSYRTYSQRNASFKFVWGHWNPINIALQFKWRDN